MHDDMRYVRIQGQGQGHSREVDRQSPTGLIFCCSLLSLSLCLLCGIRQCVSDWLSSVVNSALADKPDHIRRNAVDAVHLAAPSVVVVAQSRRAVDDGWNVLALRSDSVSFSVTSLC